jgi:hypothetical protein
MGSEYALTGAQRLPRGMAGKEGQVTAISPGYSRIVVDVRIRGNNFDTVCNESDLVSKETKRR